MKKVSLLGILFILSITALILVANLQKDTNTISINNPDVMKASTILLTVLFVPPILLAFLKKESVAYFRFTINSYFYCGFHVLIPTALFHVKGIFITILAIDGTFISLRGMAITKPRKK